MKKVIISDIDGTIIPDKYNPVYNRPTKSINLSKKMVSYFNTMIKMKADIVFLTGRPPQYENITKNLLKPINKYKIFFHSFNNKEWSEELYNKFKLNHIIEISKEYDIIVILEDRYNVLKYITNNKQKINKIVLMLHVVYLEEKGDMLCREIMSLNPYKN